MILEGKLGEIFIEAVKDHVGHDIVLVGYVPAFGDPGEYSIECETCGCVLVTAPIKEKR
jgi:hypothetical protein